MAEQPPPWERLSAKVQDVFRQLGTRSHKAIKKIKTQHLIDAIRESKMMGYDDTGPYKMLEHEVGRRDSHKKYIIALVVGVVATAGFLLKLVSGS